MKLIPTIFICLPLLGSAAESTTPLLHRIACGNNFTAYIKNDGSIAAWGENGSGQLNAPKPTIKFTSIAAGFDHVVGQLENGTVLCWGSNTRGQCNVPNDLDQVVMVAAGPYQSLALKADGSIVNWGYVYDPNPVYSDPPPTGPINAQYIACTWANSLAISADGSVTRWGARSYYSTLPIGPTELQDVTSANYNACGITKGGQLACYGFKGPTITNGVRVAGGQNHLAILLADGTVSSWLDPNVGDQPAGYQGAVGSTPLGLDNVVEVSAGPTHNIALRADGSLVGWGDDTYGQISASPSLLNLPESPPSMPSQAVYTVYSNRPYPINIAIQATGHPTTFSFTNVPGMNFKLLASGLLYGNVENSNSSYMFDVFAANSKGSARQTITIRVVPPPVTPIPPVITSATSTIAYVGYPFTYTIGASNAPTTYAATGLPAGWTVNATTGVIAGTATAASGFTVQITASNSAGSDTKTLSIVAVTGTPPSTGGGSTGSGGGGGCGLGGGMAIFGSLALLARRRGWRGQPRNGSAR